MEEACVRVKDLQALVELAEGFIAENGIAATERYTPPPEVKTAISNVKEAISKTKEQRPCRTKYPG